MCLGVLLPSEFRGEAKKFEGEAPPVSPLDETLQALWSLQNIDLTYYS